MPRKKKDVSERFEEPAVTTADGLKLRQEQERNEMYERHRAENDAERERTRAERDADRRADREQRRTENILRALGRLGYECDDDGGYDDHGYKFDNNGNLERTCENIQNLFTEHPDHAGKFRRNTFTWLNEYDGEPIDDDVFDGLYDEVEKKLGFFNQAKVDTAINNVCKTNRFHPILDVVDKLEWDSVPRAETFFIDRLGAPDTPLTREISFKWLFAMYKRVKEPACYFDHYLIISDAQQGTGKSKTFERLTDWLGTGYTANNLSADTRDKDNAMYINSCVIGLFDETDQIKYAALESFKKFVTTGVLKMRVPYARTVGDYKVHCVYCATTNESEFLTDSTSSYERRAWVLFCEGDTERQTDEWEKLNNPDEMKQVWAELAYWYREENRASAPWDIRGNRVTYLTDDNVKALQEVQLGAKTTNSDTATNNAIETILNQLYSKDTSDGRSAKTKVFATEKEFSEDHRKYYGDDYFKYPLKKIPFRWFCGYVNRELHSKVSRREVYIRSIIESGELRSVIGEWKIGWVFYNGTKQKCIYRADNATPKNKEVEPENPEKPSTPVAPVNQKKDVSHEKDTNTDWDADDTDFEKLDL